MQIAPPDYDRMFGALADATRRDIVRRAIEGNEGVAELADHYPMSFAAVQKHIAILEARSLLDRYEELWQGRIDRMAELVTDTKEKDQ
jgi:DNA-binding transcriptional ArsR family regulator